MRQGSRGKQEERTTPVKNKECMAVSERVNRRYRLHIGDVQNYKSAEFSYLSRVIIDNGEYDAVRRICISEDIKLSNVQTNRKIEINK